MAAQLTELSLVVVAADAPRRQASAHSACIFPVDADVLRREPFLMRRSARRDDDDDDDDDDEQGSVSASSCFPGTS